jgi:hypothetical protein
MKKISLFNIGEEDNTIDFWKSKTPDERLSTVEFLREQCYIIQGYDKVPAFIREIHVIEN